MSLWPHRARLVSIDRLFQSWQETLVLAVALFLAASVGGCAFPRIENGQFIDEAHHFSVALPAGQWEQMDLAGGDLALRSRQTSATYSITVNCPKTPPEPLPALARQLVAGLADRSPLLTSPGTLAGQPALMSRWTATADSVPIMVEAWVVSYRGCVYDFLYVAEPPDFALQLGEYRAFLKGFRFQ